MKTLESRRRSVIVSLTNKVRRFRESFDGGRRATTNFQGQGSNPWKRARQNLFKKMRPSNRYF